LSGGNDGAKLIGVSIYSENIAVQFNNSNATIERCLLYNPLHGSGIYCNSSSPNIINCTVAGFDNAIHADDNSIPNINSSILWSEELGIIGPASIKYSCIKYGLNNSVVNEGGNIFSDPYFDIQSGFGNIDLGWRQIEYPWIGYPWGPHDGKDNNPWNYTNDTPLMATTNDGRYVRIGNGEPNHGDLDGDGVAGEDWFNGYDDDGDCSGDTNGDGCLCCTGDISVDEDYFTENGVDDDGDGYIDEDIDSPFVFAQRDYQCLHQCIHPHHHLLHFL
jgi:hypothetical protein